MVTITNKHNSLRQVWFQNRRAKFRKTERLNQQKVSSDGSGNNNNNTTGSGGRASPANTAANTIKSELGGKQSPGSHLSGSEHKAEMKSGRSPSPSPLDEQHLSPPARSPMQSPLSTVNTSQLTSLPPQSPLPSQPSKHFSPPPASSMPSYYPAPPSHAPYHASNTFSSPLSALLGSSSHYLFNSESKGPTVQIF